MDVIDLYPKRIEVTTPYLTFGSRQDIESKFGIERGKKVLISSKGDLDLVTIFFSLIVARTSLIETDHPPIKTVVSYPSMYTKVDILTKYIDDILLLKGVASRINVIMVPIKSADDLISSIESLGDVDVYFNVYFDYHLNDTNLIKKALSAIDAKKGNCMTILGRFDRHKKTITDNVDVELLLNVTRYLPEIVSFIPAQKMMVGKTAGTYVISLANNPRMKVSLNLQYPALFC